MDALALVIPLKAVGAIVVAAVTGTVWIYAQLESKYPKKDAQDLAERVTGLEKQVAYLNGHLGHSQGDQS